MTTTRSQLPSKSNLSLCMIVKDEKLNLPRCLASVQSYVDEIVIVDTGSQDGTPEIAAHYGAKVSHFEWCNDFAAARNYAISQVSGEWILMLDADEELVIKSNSFLQDIKNQSKILAYTLIRTEVNVQEEMTPLHTTRLFRNLPEMRYVGRFHEQLKYQNQPINSDKRSHLESVMILHYGYGKEEIHKKNVSRNIPMLERLRQEEGLSLMLLYCLSGMYNDMQQTEKYRECCAEALDRLLPNLLEGRPPEDFDMVPSLVYTLGAQSLNQEDYETARLLCQRGLEWCSHYPPLNYLAGMLLMDLGFPLGSTTYLEKCLQLGREGNYYKGEPFEQSFLTTEPAFALGIAYIRLNRWLEAKTAFELALSYDPNCEAASQNLEKLKNILAS